MSLDITLTVKDSFFPKKGSGIFVRRDGCNVEVSEEEWARENPGKQPARLVADETHSGEVYEANITHNLSEMAEAAGIYTHLWRPEELGITKACELVMPLGKGLRELRSNPEHYRQFEPANGWGTYDGLVKFVLDYLVACVMYPEAEVSVDR